MSLRSVGNQLLQTSPSLLLARASTASLSLWVRVNPGCDVANPAGVEIFGDNGGKVSATLSGSGGLRLGWSSNDGKANYQSTCNLTLTPGTSYHLAAIWQAGSQQYFVNGVEIGSDSQPGSLGVLGDAASHAFRLGSDSAGTDVTLDEPTLWVGYALSPQDIRNLRDRIVHPASIAPASIALEWTLAGTDGVAAAVGDAGLADGSPTGLNLNSIVGTAPTYQSGVLSYAPSATIGRAMVAPSGQAVVVVVEDGSASPVDVTSLMSPDNIQQLSITGTPAGPNFTLAFNGQTTASIPIATLAPLNYGLWTATVASGVAQQVAATWRGFPWMPTAQLYEVFDSDGTTLLGSATFNMTANPVGVDDGQVDTYNEPVIWQSIGTVTPSGASITVRITSPVGQLITADGLRVENTATSAIQYLDDQGGAFAMTAADGSAAAVTGQGHFFDGTFSQIQGSGVSVRHTIDPATIQADLLALSSVQPGGLVVTAADTHDSSPYTITFGGPMGGVSQPTLTSSDPAIVPSVVNPGGVFPTISINGGASISLKHPIWGAGLPNGVGGGQAPPDLPFVMWPLPQSAPATQFATAFSAAFSATGSGLNSGQGGYSDGVAVLGAGETATLLFPCLPPGTYKVSITWPASTGQSSVPYAVTDNAGNTLATATVDQTVAPSDFTDAGVGWKVLGTFTVATNTDLAVVVSAGAAAATTMDAARLDRTSPDASIVVGPGDVVTFSANPGWASTAAGPVEGATALTLQNLVGGAIMPAFAPASVTMPVGYNVAGDNPIGTILVYSNIAKRVQWGTSFPAVDANGYPTTLAGSSLQLGVLNQVGDYNGLGHGVPAFPAGQYTIMWDGASPLTINPGLSTLTPVSSNLTGTTDNTIVVDLAPAASQFAPVVTMTVHGTTPDPTDPTGTRYLCDFRNFRVYPPGIDATNPPKFHPSFLAKLQGARSLRFLDPLTINSGNIVNFSDFITVDRFNYFDAPTFTIPVASVSGYTGAQSTTGFDATNFVLIQITTSADHGLTTGQYAQLINTGTAQISDGSSFNLGYSGSVVQVLSPTVLLIALAGDSSHPGRTMTNTVVAPAAGQLTYQVGGGGGMPFTDCVELFNTVGSAESLHLNIPGEATDACVTAMADYVAANTAPGSKVRVEYSNECWNFDFWAFASCCLKSALILKTPGYTDYESYYVYRMKQVHDLVATSFQAAGRSGDLVRVMGAQAGYSGILPALIADATKYGATFDEVCIAPYLSNDAVSGGPEPTQASVYNLMTTPQHLDLFELNILHAGPSDYVAAHRSILDAAGLQAVRVICYEGGPQFGVSAAVTVRANQRSWHVIRHPRMYGAMLGFLKTLQDAGNTLFNDYILSGGLQQYTWGAYYGWDMQPGTGDPTLDASNATSPDDLPAIKSEVGGAINTWNAALPAPTPPAPSKPKRIIPGRNGGKFKAIGFPRAW